MLGLSRVGVTTVIYADNVNTRKRGKKGKGDQDPRSPVWPGWGEKSSESTTELNDMENAFGDSKMDWTSGIRTTTTVTRTIES